MNFLYLQVNARFKELIEGTKKLWSDVSLVGRWPSTENMALFERYVLSMVIVHWNNIHAR